MTGSIECYLDRDLHVQVLMRMRYPVDLRFHTVFEFVNSMLFSAVCTAVKNAITFHTMTDHAAATVGAGGRQGVDRTFKTVENM
jgi:hypothetical protein